MAFKKITQKAIFSCFKPRFSSCERKISVAEKNSLKKRLSLSDISDPHSAFSTHDLSSSLLGSNLFAFTLAELKLITSNFSMSNYLGEGGFGTVYKGFFDDEFCPALKAQPVAVKVLDLDGTQGHKEWLAEIIILGQLRHPHLVKLIGYCCEDEQRLLVYEYMENGNLENKLFRKYSAAMPWSTRLKIALGAAKGLAFLHEEEMPVIYRDFKASNVLLDSDYSAKLSDFGLATEGNDTNVTRVMGTQGYAAPEYITKGYLTTMSDVYSFGVVLLELLTGRRALDKSRPSRQKNLVDFARPLLKDSDKLYGIMDPRLECQYSVEGAKKAALLAYQCLSHNPRSRPSMRTVVNTLEPLMNLNDLVVPFVYIVPTISHVNDPEKGKEDNKPIKRSDDNDHGSGRRNKDEEKFEKGKKHCGRQRKGERQRRRIKPWRSRAIYSDMDLYRKLGTSLYSPVSRMSKEEKEESS